ncbi:hypothetical protein bcgnr5414_53990 [Bacillus cereus]
MKNKKMKEDKVLAKKLHTKAKSVQFPFEEWFCQCYVYVILTVVPLPRNNCQANNTCSAAVTTTESPASVVVPTSEQTTRQNLLLKNQVQNLHPTSHKWDVAP